MDSGRVLGWVRDTIWRKPFDSLIKYLQDKTLIIS